MTDLVTAQASLFGLDDALPPGLAFEPAFVAPDEERSLLALAATLPLREATYRQYTARRRVHVVEPAGFPPVLAALRDRLAAWAGVEPEAFVHALFSAYRPGTPLGWHRDAPQYGTVVGVSLGGPATLRLRPWPPERGRRAEALSLHLSPRSAYRLQGAARWGWQHAVPPVPAPRWSITLRTARG
jgi:alkylated DNA repair dioxygenase AlkB